MSAEAFITIDEVAELLRTPKATVYRWVHEGWIPNYKVGRRVLFKLSEVLNWLKKSCHRPGRPRRSLK